MPEYRIEGDEPLRVYTADQLGEPEYKPRSARSKEDFGVIVMDGANQVEVLSGCSWQVCRERVKHMVRAGVDRDDIRAVAHGPSAAPQMPDGRLVGVNVPLWWTDEDQQRLDREREAT